MGARVDAKAEGAAVADAQGDELGNVPGDYDASLLVFVVVSRRGWAGQE